MAFRRRGSGVHQDKGYWQVIQSQVARGSRQFEYVTEDPIETFLGAGYITVSDGDDAQLTTDEIAIGDIVWFWQVTTIDDEQSIEDDKASGVVDTRICIVTDNDGNTITFVEGSFGAIIGGGHTIQENGTPLTSRSGLNFGNGLVASDNAGSSRTDVVADYASEAEAEAGVSTVKLMTPERVAQAIAAIQPATHTHVIANITDAGALASLNAVDSGQIAPAAVNGSHLDIGTGKEVGFVIKVASIDGDGLPLTVEALAETGGTSFSGIDDTADYTASPLQVDDGDYNTERRFKQTIVGTHQVIFTDANLSNNTLFGFKKVTTTVGVVITLEGDNSVGDEVTMLVNGEEIATGTPVELLNRGWGYYEAGTRTVHLTGDFAIDVDFGGQNLLNINDAEIEGDATVGTLDVAGNATFGGRAIGLVETLSFHIPVVEDKSYFLDQFAKYPYNVVDMSIRTQSGTCTAALEIEGTPVTSISAVAVTSTEQTATASAANAVAVGNTFHLEITSNSSGLDLRGSIQIVRT